MKDLKDMLNESRQDIDKDIEKQLKEVSREYDDGETEAKYIARDAAEGMAYWMKGYMISVSCRWLEEALQEKFDANDSSIRKFLADFKHAMGF